MIPSSARLKSIDTSTGAWNAFFGFRRGSRIVICRTCRQRAAQKGSTSQDAPPQAAANTQNVGILLREDALLMLPLRPLNYTIPYRTLPYHTVSYHTLPYRTMTYHTLSCHAMPCHAMPYLTMTYMDMLASKRENKPQHPPHEKNTQAQKQARSSLLKLLTWAASI